ncbi:HlyU family transcriptional regulator [Spiribacter pallidus]|uniref:HlyU family transcriptional regulator n=1 Tax=Spiribacter pallidus TaxID=1987936 RepID=A0ABV3TCI1_9GAMM
MQWLKRLFGQTAEQNASAAVTRDYGEYRIAAHPRKESGGYRVAGTITRAPSPHADAEPGPVEFVRADVYGSHEVAVEMTLLKGERLVDEQGSALFSARR